MTKDQLARLLAAAVAIPTLLVTAGCECPHPVAIEGDDRPLDSAAACDVAVALRQNPSVQGSSAVGMDCAAICGETKYNSCYLDPDYTAAFGELNPYNNDTGGGGAIGGGGGSGGSGGSGAVGVACPAQSAIFTCEVTQWQGHQYSFCPIAGRRPEGLANLRQDPTAMGRYLASSAYYEAAAVIAFERLALELAALGAPSELQAELARAARDERRHAATMTAEAVRYGMSVEAPVVAPPGPRSVEAIAVENVVEGLVNEAFAAAVALFQAEHAEDPVLRAAMRRIADDECAHAALALRIACFLDAHLDDAARARVEASRRRAVAAFGAGLEEPSPEVRRLAGVPTRAEATSIHGRLCRSLWGIDARGAGEHPASLAAA